MPEDKPAIDWPISSTIADDDDLLANIGGNPRRIRRDVVLAVATAADIIAQTPGKLLDASHGRGFVDAGLYIIGNGTTDDTTALQNAVNAIPLNGGAGGVLFIPAGANCRISQIDLPLDRDIFIFGYGAKLNSVTGAPILSRMITNQSQFDNVIDYRVGISGLRFSGNLSIGQKGALIGATYGSFIRDCRSELCDIGFDIQGGLLTLIEHSRTAFNKSDAIVVRVGQWTGATTANAQSNHSTIFHVRDFANSSATSSFRIEGSSGVRVIDCINEGQSADNNIVFDGQNGTNARHFEVTNLHSENIPTNAIIKLVNNSRIDVDIDKIWFQAGSVVVDGADLVNSTINIRNIPGWPTGSKFKKGSNNTWIFWEGFPPGVDIYDTANWVGASLPTGIYHFDTTYIDGGGNPNLLFNVGDSREIYFNANIINVLRDNQTDLGRINAGRFKNIHVVNSLTIASLKVIGAQGAAVADATDAASAITQLNALLARIRAHGLIAT